MADHLPALRVKFNPDTPGHHKVDRCPHPQISPDTITIR